MRAAIEVAAMGMRGADAAATEWASGSGEGEATEGASGGLTKAELEHVRALAARFESILEGQRARGGTYKREEEGDVVVRNVRGWAAPVVVEAATVTLAESLTRGGDECGMAGVEVAQEERGRGRGRGRGQRQGRGREGGRGVRVGGEGDGEEGVGIPSGREGFRKRRGERGGRHEGGGGRGEGHGRRGRRGNQDGTGGDRPRTAGSVSGQREASCE